MRRLSLGIYRRRDETSIEEVERDAAQVMQAQFLTVDAKFGTGNMVPFSRVLNPWKKPPSLHYPIPACVAHGRLLRCKDVNHVPKATDDAEQQSA